MIFKVPFQPKPFCDSMILTAALLHCSVLRQGCVTVCFFGKIIKVKSHFE